MWNDIMRASNDSQENSHFMGSIVYVGTETATATFSTWLVIDGQQRLTTLILLLTALRDHITEISTEENSTVGKIDDYLKNRHEAGEEKYKLALRRADNATLQELVDGGKPNERDSSMLILQAYQWFRAQIKNYDPELVYLGIARLTIVDVTLDRNTDNPQLVFESLNSTGVDLSQSDLIRNYLLMGLTESEQTRLYNAYWERIETLFRRTHRRLDLFLRDYIALATQSATQTREAKIYDAFKDFKASVDDSLEELLRKMARFAGHYMRVSIAADSESAALTEELRHVRALATTHMVLGMKLYECYKCESPSLSESQFVEALRLIESFIVRRGVLGWQARDYWSIFATIAREIDDNQPLESLKVALARQRYHFPTDEQFSRGIQETNLYWYRDLCWHILTRLENDGQKEPSPVGQYSIEHIMPQGIDHVLGWQEMLGDGWEAAHQEWIHRLGNLTLTGYNSTLSNRLFHEKKTIDGGFDQSAARLNQYVRNQQVWTVTEMNERGRSLAQIALNIWPHHGADEELLRKRDIAALREKAAQRNVDNLRITSAARVLLNTALAEIRKIGDVIEVIERGSVCCYGPSFFVEILPMSYYIRFILPLDFDEVDVLESLYIHDTTTWSFVPNRAHTECNILIDVFDDEDIMEAMPVVRKAFGMEDE